MQKKSARQKTIRVARTRNGNTETLSQHLTKIRSALRSLTRFNWVPKKQALVAARSTTLIGRRKVYVYTCAVCLGKYKANEVEVDHIIPVGSLKSYTDLPEFCTRLFVEDPALLRVVCKPCHKQITHGK